MQASRLKHWLVIMSLLSPTIAFADEVIDKAQALIKAGDYKAAYELLEPLETERSGDVQYDMLLGISGVQAGENSRGIFALERVLAQDPNNIEARTMIAKGYYRAGEAENAKSEFNNVLSQKPNQELTKLIESNMLAIDKATGQTTAFAAYLDFGFGHDSNINAATSNSTVNAVNPIVSVTSLTPVALTANSREQGSNFVNAAAGISVRVPLTKDLAAFGSLSGNNKINWSNEQFDTSSLDYSVGLNLKHNIDSYTLAVQGGSFSVNANTFREAVGLSGQWLRDVDDRNQVNAFVQISDLDYPDISVRNAKRYIVGGGWGHSFAGDKAKTIYITGYGGKEKTDDSTFDFFSNNIFGVRAGGQLAINYKLVAYAGVSYEYRDYDKQDPSFLKTRRDDQYDFNIGLRYLPGNNFTVRPQLSYVDNRSNTSLFEFDRYILSINVRKDFNW